MPSGNLIGSRIAVEGQVGRVEENGMIENGRALGNATLHFFVPKLQFAAPAFSQPGLRYKIRFTRRRQFLL